MIARGIELDGDVSCVCKVAEEGGGRRNIFSPPLSFPEKKNKKKDGQTASKDGFIFLLRRVVRKWIDFLTSWHLDIKESIDPLIGFVL